MGGKVNSEANARRISLVESCFGSAGQPLAVPGRVLVGEGVLTKACRKKSKPRQFYLFNDILIYGNIIINKKKYNKQHIIPLEEVKLQPLEDEGQFRNGWLICTKNKSFAVYAATGAEKQEWMAHIEKCVKDLLNKSGKKPLNEHAAVWVPDSEAPVCMLCKKSQFSLVNRRHHCRKCGAVVCGGCSNRKAILPSQSTKPLRVCDTCFEELEKSRDGPNAQVPPIQAPTRTKVIRPTETPPRPPPPKLFGPEDDPERVVPLPEIPQGHDQAQIPAKHPKMYELVAMSAQETSFWWDSVEEDVNGLTEAEMEVITQQFKNSGFSPLSIQDGAKSADSSSDDDSDEEVSNGNIEEGSQSSSSVGLGGDQPLQPEWWTHREPAQKGLSTPSHLGPIPPMSQRTP
ncbi:pleckstrin homology domain-containing family F member 2-like isoform X2 [Tigriopus californicus]|uniref:pleckstrin homology domain-containing family F member 2-like isoform X2 n=1 Tax=Tigriopus californicus TaxID=6832 RepID=UPI0027DA9209|nr:pleckstrin homology domain-containing family F member 2-like isoform X2 [Tigriopus californicus]